MCGRFSLGVTIRVGQLFDLPNWPETPPRCNIAPSQEVRAVIQNRETGAREFRPFRWGLVPSCATDLAIGDRMINARSETAAAKPVTSFIDSPSAHHAYWVSEEDLYPAPGPHKPPPQNPGRRGHSRESREEHRGGRDVIWFPHTTPGWQEGSRVNCRWKGIPGLTGCQ